MKNNSKQVETKSNEETIVAVSLAEKQANSIERPNVAEKQDHDRSAQQHSMPPSESKPPTEAIDPMTLSIVPSTKAPLAHIENEAGQVTSQSDHKTNQEGGRWVADLTNNAAQTRKPGVSHQIASTAEPTDDLMMFSITPASITQMTPSPGGLQQFNHPPSSKPEQSGGTEGGSSDDLIEFSISPSLLANAHRTSMQYGSVADAKSRSHYSMSGSIHPNEQPMHTHVASGFTPALPTEPQLQEQIVSTSHSQSSKSRQSPKLNVARKSPELSNDMLKAGRRVAHQEKSEISHKKATPPLQRQTSFPFQSKQPAPLLKENMKTDVHAIPQSSDFASGYTNLESGDSSDVLKPNWEHFAESEEERRKKILPETPETWTILNVVGEEEATFTTGRQFSDDFSTATNENSARSGVDDTTGEEVKFTPAITSLKRVASYHGQEKTKSAIPISSRPLPSLPYEVHSTVPALPLNEGGRVIHSSPTIQRAGINTDNRDISPVTSPTAHLSPARNIAKFSTHHYPSSGDTPSPQTGLGAHRLASASKPPDHLYADPGDLVFSKPSLHQQMYSSHSHPHSASRTTGNSTLGVGGSTKNNQRENYVEIAGTVSRSDEELVPISTHQELHTSTEGSKASAGDGGGLKKAVLGGGSGTDEWKEGGEFASPPITADPLYAIPEKVKLKLASQGMNYSSDTKASDKTYSGESSTSALSSAGSVKATNTGTSSKPITGAEYLSTLLQQRQSVRQLTSASVLTPRGDLLEASTKVRAGSSVDMSPTSIEYTFIGDCQTSTPRQITGKEYLKELLQKRQESKPTQHTTISGTSPQVTCASQATDANPLYAVPDKPKVKQHLAHTERNSNGTNLGINSSNSVNSKEQASNRNSTPIGQDPLYAVPDKQHLQHIRDKGIQIMSRATVTTIKSETTPQLTSHGKMQGTSKVDNKSKCIT